MQMNQTSLRQTERTYPLRASLGDRIGAGVVALLCLSVLSMAAWLTPSSEGHGTHKKLGLAPCMWAVTLDKPCPTCGMTTSFSHAGEGSWIQAAKVQPMGALLALMTATVFWGASVQALFGAHIGSIIQPTLRPRTFLVFGALLLLAWFYKIATW
tara:strand:- start:98598 stop:99062 length:465 start_codon:yes stop_codon:yes gene_type:complete